MAPTSHALLQSLIHGPLLVGDLPEAVVFGREALVLPDPAPCLNLEQKLGHLYEDALAVVLEASDRFELLSQNLPLRTDIHTTVGELDFLVRDLESSKLIHLELATKFYLAVETVDGLELPGPDARDNYFRKLHRLRSHQLRLASSHRDCLPKQYRDEPILVRQLIYGCLFDHIRAISPAVPAFSHSGCRRGRWLTVDECADHFPPETRLQVIPKPLWPVPLEFLDEVDLERWVPPRSLDRCVMVRVNDGPIPYFVAPSGYPR